MLRRLFGLSWQEVFARLFGLFWTSRNIRQMENRRRTVSSVKGRLHITVELRTSKRIWSASTHTPSKVKSELQGSVEKLATQQKAQPPITQHAIAKPSNSPTACSEPRNSKNAINDLITDWLVADLRPLSIVPGEGFLRLFSFLEPGYTVPCRTFFISKRQRRHEGGGGGSVREERVSEGQWHLSFNRHIGTSRVAEAYHTAAVHFVDGDWILRTGFPENASYPGSHTGVRIAERRKETATRFGLKPEQIVGFVHDEAANVELAGTLLLDSDEWETIVCGTQVAKRNPPCITCSCQAPSTLTENGRPL